jgi:replication factor A1
MTNIQLSAGAVKAMYASQQVSQPTVQVIDIKKVQSQANQQNQERYRLIISDGVNYQQAMLGTQQNALIKDGKIETNCIVRLTDHICNNVNNRRFVICVLMFTLAPLNCS